MSIAQVVDHLYVIEKKEDGVTISFLTSRMPWFIPILGILGLCSAVVWGVSRLGGSGTTIFYFVCGSIGVCAPFCFSVAEHITRYVITIEADLVTFRREFQGIPVASKKIYPRVLLTDLGVYPNKYPHSNGPSLKSGRLCIWAEGKSIEIERFFPIIEGVSLAKDLRRMGIEFPRTFEVFDETQLIFAQKNSYLSF
jgi:hypothetical protein